MVSVWEKKVNAFDRHTYVVCAKCGKDFFDGDTMIRHRRSGGRSNAYHKECYEEMYH